MVTSSQLDGGFLADFNRIVLVVSRCGRRLKVVGSNPTQTQAIQTSSKPPSTPSTFNLRPQRLTTQTTRLKSATSFFCIRKDPTHSAYLIFDNRPEWEAIPTSLTTEKRKDLRTAGPDQPMRRSERASSSFLGSAQGSPLQPKPRTLHRTRPRVVPRAEAHRLVLEYDTVN